MRLKAIVLAALGAAALLGGCAKDPQVNGPYLIGAERPAIRDGSCCPIGDVRSQDVNSGFTPCKREAGRCPAAAPPPDAETGSADPKPPVHPVDLDKVLRSSTAGTGARASAWN